MKGQTRTLYSFNISEEERAGSCLCLICPSMRCSQSSSLPLSCFCAKDHPDRSTSCRQSKFNSSLAYNTRLTSAHPVAEAIPPHQQPSIIIMDALIHLVRRQNVEQGDQNIGSAISTTNTSVSAFVSTLVYNLIIFGVLVALFVILRKSNRRIYAPRTYVGFCRVA